MAKRIANSTAISNRMFRSSKFMIFLILSFFIVILLITAFAGRTSINSQDMYSKASDKLMDYYASAGTSLGNKFFSDKSEAGSDSAPEEGEETEVSDKQKQKQYDQKQKQIEDKAEEFKQQKAPEAAAGSAGAVDPNAIESDIEADPKPESATTEDVAGLI